MQQDAAIVPPFWQIRENVLVHRDASWADSLHNRVWNVGHLEYRAKKI